MHSNPSRTLFQHFQQNKTRAVPYHNIFNRLKPHHCLIIIFLMEENLSFTSFQHFQQYKKDPSCTLFQHFQQNQTPAVPYYNIFNRLKPHHYLIITFLMEENPSLTSFQHFQQYKTPAVPCFSILNKLKLQLHLLFAF